VSLILDAGALLAVERADRDVVALIKRERASARVPVTHGGVVGQVWRGGDRRQANLARLLPGIDTQPIDDELGRRAGILLGAARTSDVIDAAVVLLAVDGDDIITSDPSDLAVLAQSAGLHIELIPI
jgi:hypothetical protein